MRQSMPWIELSQAPQLHELHPCMVAPCTHAAHPVRVYAEHQGCKHHLCIWQVHGWPHGAGLGAEPCHAAAMHHLPGSNTMAMATQLTDEDLAVASHSTRSTGILLLCCCNIASIAAFMQTPRDPGGDPAAVSMSEHQALKLKCSKVLQGSQKHDAYVWGS